MRTFPVPLPAKMQALPVDRRGYPIPAFVEHLPDGGRDFRIMSMAHMVRCVKHGMCWVCGGQLGAIKCFPIGPMCAVNRISAEPPSHYECGFFSAMACPFLTLPKAVRREAGLAEVEIVRPPGEMLLHNPGLVCLWVTKAHTMERHGDGMLFRLAEPLRLEFYTEARPATRSETDAAIARGLPKLAARAAEDGPKALAELERQTARLNLLLERQQFAPEPLDDLPDLDVAAMMREARP